MPCTFRFLLPCLLILVAFAPSAFAAEEPSRYDMLMKGEEPLKTIRSLGVAMMVLPYDHDNMVKQLRGYLWANSPEVKLDDAAREIENARFSRQLEAVEKLMAKYKVHAVDLIGFTPVGSMSFLDLYYLFETDNGPVVIRTSMHFRGDGGHLFGFEPFEGWDRVRELLKQIEHRSGAMTLKIRINPPAKEDGKKL